MPNKNVLISYQQINPFDSVEHHLLTIIMVIVTDPCINKELQDKHLPEFDYVACSGPDFPLKKMRYHLARSLQLEHASHTLHAISAITPSNKLSELLNCSV